MKDIKDMFKAKEIKRMMNSIYYSNEGDEYKTLEAIHEYIDSLIYIENLIEENDYLKSRNNTLEGKLKSINKTIDEIDSEMISKVLDPATYNEKDMNDCFCNIKVVLDMVRAHADRIKVIPDDEIPF